MTQSFCKIASFVNVSEAECARCKLESEGIPAQLDNVNTVLWSWNLSQATGGVRLLVPQDHVERAREILSRRDPSPATGGARCARCGEEILSGWDACWQCGWPGDDIRQAEHRESPLPRPEIDSESPIDFDAETERVLSTREQSQTRRKEAGSRAVRRAWTAAVFSLAFPPLAFCAIATLCRIRPRRMNVEGFDRFRYYAAWTLGLFEGALCTVVAILLVRACVR